MCLIDKKKYRWTKEDIPIWKVVRIKVYSNSDRMFLSPYKCTPLTTTNVIVDEKKPSALRMFFANLDSHEYEFGKGFFHAFTRYEDAVVLKNRFEWYVGFYTIVKGYIPKNTRYAISMHNPYEVCARKIVLNI